MVLSIGSVGAVVERSVGRGFALDADAEGRVVGFEVEDASEQNGLERLIRGALRLSELIVSQRPVTA